MNKELTPLEALERIKSHYNDKVCVDVLDDFDIIETALKRLAVYETFGLLDEKDDVDKLTDIKGKLTYVDRVMDTQERLLASVSSDEIRILNSVLNSQIRNLKKKLKALEIIKKIVKIVDYSDHTIANGNLVILQGGEIKTREEYDLLKEVLL